jgi:hypothetical protein
MNYYFSISISYKDFLPYYQGQAHAIVVTATNGQRVQFPAMHMRKFLTPSGISGTFCLKTINGKFSSLEKISA